MCLTIKNALGKSDSRIREIMKFCFKNVEKAAERKTYKRNANC